MTFCCFSQVSYEYFSHSATRSFADNSFEATTIGGTGNLQLLSVKYKWKCYVHLKNV